MQGRALRALVLGLHVAGVELGLWKGPEIALDHPGALPAFVHRPDDERLTAAGVARGENAFGRGSVGSGLDVASAVRVAAEPGPS